MNENILEDVLEEFAKLAAIPRPSKHEAQVSNFLKNFFTERGFEVLQDRFKNIIAEIPASFAGAYGYGVRGGGRLRVQPDARPD